jgi:hypothetical protein
VSPAASELGKAAAKAAAEVEKDQRVAAAKEDTALKAQLAAANTELERIKSTAIARAARGRR